MSTPIAKAARILDFNDRLGSTQELHVLISKFFTHVYHDQGMSFLQRGELMADIDSGSASPLLVKAMCAASGRFLDNADELNPDGGELPAAWAQDVKNGLMADTDQLSVSKLAAMVILIHHEFNGNRMVSAWMLISFAVRMALAMTFSVESTDQHLSWLRAEKRRRLMWAVLCADAVGAGGLDQYTLCPPESVKINLPSDEYFFNIGAAPPNVMPSLSQVMDRSMGDGHLGRACNGLMARWVWIMAIRSEALR